jgi:hypothetical protein
VEPEPESQPEPQVLKLFALVEPELEPSGIMAQVPELDLDSDPAKVQKSKNQLSGKQYFFSRGTGKGFVVKKLC